PTAYRQTVGVGRDWTKCAENGGSTMLVLTRKNQESVVVGGAAGFAPLCKVTVLEIRGGKVRLGFEVDAEVPVHRLEVWEQIRIQEGTDGPTAGLAPPLV